MPVHFFSILCVRRGFSGRNVADVGQRARSEGELVELAHKGAHEGVRLLGPDESVSVDVEPVPGLLEVCFNVARDFLAFELVGGLEDDASGLGSSLLHEDAGAVRRSGVVLALGRVLGEDLIHDLILVSTVEVGGLHADSLSRVEECEDRRHGSEPHNNYKF